MFQFSSTTDLLNEGVRLNLFNRALVGIVRSSGERQYFCSTDANLHEMSVFDIASITKFLIAILYNILCEKGLPLTHQTKVSSVLEMKGDYVDELTVGHLLCFRTLFNRGYPAKEAMQKGLENFRSELLFGGMKVKPGSIFSYGNLHTVVLGWLLEELTHTPLHTLFEEHLKNPLGMNRTVQYPFPFHADLVQASHDVPLGTIHDPAARMAYAERKVLLGSAGLFSCAADLLSVLEILLNDGVFDGRRILSKDTVRGFPNGTYPGFGYGLPLWNTFRHNLEANCPNHDDPKGLFKLGHTGCEVATLPTHGFGYTVLTDFLMIQRTAEEEKAQRSILNHLFAAIPNTVQ